GTFRSEVRLPVGTVPLFLLVADVNGDGQLDLATANYVSGDVSLLFGRGDGTFRAETRVAADAGPVALGVGDFNRDGRPDLAVANQTSDEVTVFLARPDGMFQASGRFTVGRLPRSLVVADFNGDGFLDLAAANNNSDDVSVLLGRGDGTFRDQVRYPVERYPFALVATDLNGDGRVDLATANQLGAESSILLGLGDGTFVTPDTVANPRHATPLIADLNRDGVADITEVSRDGRILFRAGRAGAPGTFEAPVVVNPDPLFAARDLTLLRTPVGAVLAALDARGSAVSLYEPGPDGTFRRTAGPVVPGTLPVRLASADLNGDGRGDLAVVAAGSRQVAVFLQNGTGNFGPADYLIPTGVGPSDLVLADVDGDRRPDVVVTNRFSSDVSVGLNAAGAPFAAALRFRAGTGLSGLEDRGGALAVRSAEAATGLVAGRFDADTVPDLIVLDSGTNHFSLLRGDGAGGFRNAESPRSFATGVGPEVVVAGRFNNDSYLDLAVLNEDSASVSVFLGDGRGGFTEQPRLAAGNVPTGLSVNDVNADGRLDLLVGNEYGDMLTLLGNGDGTFQAYQRAGRNVALAVADLNGDGADDFIFGNQGLDRVSVHYSQPGQIFAQGRGDGLLAPGAVSLADFNGDRLPDLAVANSGANAVLIYLGMAGGQFGPARTFFAGTSPAGITVADV
ncbi:MAG TPA: VCBS repeat-containing protein, partial [Gemmataceae bacterium]|nr:VCBS repeat-containing protein [Gemmataceae bacterium]